ncbi:unnamed protein product, partial [Staurois parvus]
MIPYCPGPHEIVSPPLCPSFPMVSPPLGLRGSKREVWLI